MALNRKLYRMFLEELCKGYETEIVTLCDGCRNGDESPWAHMCLERVSTANLISIGPNLAAGHEFQTVYEKLEVEIRNRSPGLIPMLTKICYKKWYEAIINPLSRENLIKAL